MKFFFFLKKNGQSFSLAAFSFYISPSTTLPTMVSHYVVSFFKAEEIDKQKRILHIHKLYAVGLLSRITESERKELFMLLCQCFCSFFSTLFFLRTKLTTEKLHNVLGSRWLRLVSEISTAIGDKTVEGDCYLIEWLWFKSVGSVDCAFFTHAKTENIGDWEKGKPSRQGQA